MLRNLIRRVIARLQRHDDAAWLDTPAGCCQCGTGGPHYRGTRPPVTRYVYVDACGPADDTPDWSSCSAHPLDGVIPVIDYGRDLAVTFRQTEADVARALAGGLTFEPGNGTIRED